VCETDKKKLSNKNEDWAAYPDRVLVFHWVRLIREEKEEEGEFGGLFDIIYLNMIFRFFVCLCLEWNFRFQQGKL